MLKQRVTKDLLSEKFGEHNIFEYYFGPFELNKSYNSVLREDKHKSTGFFYSDDNTLIYNDFARSKSYTFVTFVMKVLGLSYHAAIQQIAVDFGLTNGRLTNGIKPTLKALKQPVKRQKKQISIVKQAFKNQHLEYWNKFGITEQELINNNVLAVKNYSINDFNIPENNELQFAYLINDIDAATKEEATYVKIYTPYSDNYKWVSNAPLNVMFGFTELPYISERLFICKAQKERLITLKLFTDVVSLQSENKGSIDGNAFRHLSEKYSNIIYFGDNDEPGVKFCQYIQETYNIKTYHFPPEWKGKFGIKDIADFVEKWGTEMLKTYFKSVLEWI